MTIKSYADSADYEAYLQGRTAVIDTASVPYYLKEATALIDHYTFDNITEITDNIRLCTCELAEELSRLDKINGKASESMGSYSVSFSNCDNRYKIFKKYLGNSGLMYLGVK